MTRVVTVRNYLARDQRHELERPVIVRPDQEVTATVSEGPGGWYFAPRGSQSRGRGGPFGSRHAAREAALRAGYKTYVFDARWDEAPFREGDHPRDPGGQFTSGGGGGKKGGGKKSAVGGGAAERRPAPAPATPSKKESVIRKVARPLVRGAATLGGAALGGVGGALGGAGRGLVEGATAPGLLGTMLTQGSLNTLLGGAGLVSGGLVGGARGAYRGGKKGWELAKSVGMDASPRGRWSVVISMPGEPAAVKYFDTLELARVYLRGLRENNPGAHARARLVQADSEPRGNSLDEPAWLVGERGPQDEENFKEEDHPRDPGGKFSSGGGGGGGKKSTSSGSGGGGGSKGGGSDPDPDLKSWAKRTAQSEVTNWLGTVNFKHTLERVKGMTPKAIKALAGEMKNQGKPWYKSNMSKQDFINTLESDHLSRVRENARMLMMYPDSPNSKKKAAELAKQGYVVPERFKETGIGARLKRAVGLGSETPEQKRWRRDGAAIQNGNREVASLRSEIPSIQKTNPAAALSIKTLTDRADAELRQAADFDDLSERESKINYFLTQAIKIQRAVVQ